MFKLQINFTIYQIAKSENETFFFIELIIKQTKNKADAVKAELEITL